jgi:hypothetical protein
MQCKTHRRRAGVLMASLWLALTGGAIDSTRAADTAQQPGAKLLPATTLFYLELHKPDDLLATLLDHPLLQRLTALPETQAALTSNPALGSLRQIVLTLEKQTGEPWRRTLAQSTAGGLVLAIDPASKGGAILARAADPAASQKFIDALVETARQTPTPQGGTIPIASAVHRGVTGHKLGSIFAAAADQWVFLANSQEFIRALIDAQQSPPRKSLADDPIFNAAWLQSSPRSAGWAFLKLKTLRDIGATAAVFKDKSDNPGAELLIGGLTSVLQDADYLAGELVSDSTRIKLTLAAPFDRSSVPKARQFYFPPDSRGAAVPLRPPGTMAALSFYRDIAGMWNAGPDLFDEAAAAKMAQADTNLGNFLGGKSFSTELLPNFRPRGQLLAVRQSFDAGHPAIPAIKLPAFAYVTEVDHPATMFPLLKASYQTLMGFLNIAAGQQGRPLFEQNVQSIGAATLLTASYIPAEEKDRNQAGLHYNFSPTMVLMDHRVMICSTHQLARQLVEAASSSQGDSHTPDNALLEVDVPAVIESLKENREPLIAQNMISKGSDRAHSEREVDLLIDLLGCFQRLTVRMTPAEPRLSLSVELTITPRP